MSTPASSGNAQSSSSIAVPSAAFTASRDLQQLQVDLRIGPEQLAAGDPEEQRVADLAGGAGDGDPVARGHHAFSISSITASANSQVPTAVGSSRVGLRS